MGFANFGLATVSATELTELDAQETQVTEGQTAETYSLMKVGCGDKLDFPEGKDVYCSYRDTDGHTEILVGNYDSVAYGKAELWIRETDGADSTVKSVYNSSVKPGYKILCSGSNSADNYDAHAKWANVNSNYSAVYLKLSHVS